MEELTANILFSGIGAQERGFMNSGLFKLDVLCTSDIDKDATLSYAAIHCGLRPELLGDYRFPRRREMADHLKSINLGYDPKKNKEYDWDKLARRKSNDLEKYYLAAILSKNKGDISRIERLPKADFWTVSFPCTNISVAGRMKGLKPDSGTQSSLCGKIYVFLKEQRKMGSYQNICFLKM